MKRCFFKSGLMAMTLAFALSFTGCSKSDDGPVYKDGCFKYADKTYNSLNAAITAALDNQDDTENIIYLLDDVLDNEPLSISDNECDKVTFNLGKFTYVSANGLDFKCVQLYLSGEGCFECRSGALSSVSRIEVDEDFNGQISAPVILNDAVMAVFSPKAMVNISQLQLDKNGIFSMEVVSEKPASVVIDRLSTQGDSKVCAIDSESVVIREGGEVHVHNYKIVGNVPANCLNAGYKVYQCEDCGEDYLDFNEGELGSCIVGDLIHHAAVEPTDTTSGNLEYWECPDCGATYSDAEGKNSFYPTLLAKNYDLPLDILFGCDEAMGKLYNGDSKGWKDNLAGFGFDLLGSLIKSAFDTSTDELLDKMNELSAKIDRLSSDMAEIRKAINELMAKVDNIRIGTVLKEYSNNVNEILSYTNKYYKTYTGYLKDSTMSPEQKRQAIDQLFKDYEKDPSVAGLDGKLWSVLTSYYKEESMEQVKWKNIPDAQAQFTRNIYMWEHLGYNLRVCVTLSDFIKLASSYAYINAYLKWTKKPQNILQMNELKTALSECLKTWQADFDDIKYREGKYRIYCQERPKYIVYEPGYYEMGHKIQDWFENRDNLNRYFFPRDNRGNNAVKSCEQVLKDVGLGNGFMEYKHLALTYDKYKDKIGGNTTAELMKFLEFPDMPEARKSNYFLVERTGEKCYEYGLKNGIINYPHYKIFQWYKWEGYRGYFHIDYVIKRSEAPYYMMYWNALRNNISMWTGSGQITDPGYGAGGKYFTVRKMDTVK